MRVQSWSVLCSGILITRVITPAIRQRIHLYVHLLPVVRLARCSTNRTTGSIGVLYKPTKHYQARGREYKIKVRLGPFRMRCWGIYLGSKNTNPLIHDHFLNLF